VTHPTEITDRAFLMTNYFAFEVNLSAAKQKQIFITDCLHNEPIAIYFVRDRRLVEKVSGYKDKNRYNELLQAISANTELILEGYYA